MVGFDYLLVVRTPARESLGDEILKNPLVNVDQIGERAHDDHVGGAGVAGGAGELVELHPEAFAVRLQLEFAGVVDDDAAFGDFAAMGFVGVFVEGDQHVKLVAGAEHLVSGDARLRPRRPSPDLGREGGEGLDVVSDLRVRLGETFRRGDHALTAFAGEADYEIGLLLGLVQWATP